MKNSSIFNYIFKLVNIFIVPLTFFLFSCNGNQQEVDAAEQKLMQVHDEGMAKMDELIALKTKLKSTSDSSAKKDLKSQADIAVQKLNAADDAMMQWMHQYKKPDEKTDETKALIYLQEEYEKMNIIKSQMDSSILAAQRLIYTYEQK